MALAVPKKLVLLSAISGKLTFFEFFPWPLLLITGVGPILSKLQIFYLASVVCFYELLLRKYLCWLIGLLPYFINLCSTCSLLVLGYFVSWVCRITLRLTLCELISCITVSSITWFLPRDAVHKRGCCIVRCRPVTLSVRLVRGLCRNE